MARGDKNYKDVVRKVNSGETADKKKAAVHKMVEALIQEDNDEAIEALRAYLAMKSREILLGEEDDMEDDDESESDEDDDDSDDDDSDDDDDDDESEDDDSDDDDESEDDDDDDDDDMEEDEEKSKKKRKSKKVKEAAVGPKANLTGASGGQWHETPPTPVRDKYKFRKGGERKGKPQEFHSNGKQAPKGDSHNGKSPKKSNDTHSSKGEWHETPPTPKDGNLSDHRRATRSNRTS